MTELNVLWPWSLEDSSDRPQTKLDEDVDQRLHVHSTLGELSRGNAWAIRIKLLVLRRKGRWNCVVQRDNGARGKAAVCRRPTLLEWGGMTNHNKFIGCPAPGAPAPRRPEQFTWSNRRDGKRTRGRRAASLSQCPTRTRKPVCHGALGGEFCFRNEYAMWHRLWLWKRDSAGQTASGISTYYPPSERFLWTNRLYSDGNKRRCAAVMRNLGLKHWTRQYQSAGNDE